MYYVVRKGEPIQNYHSKFVSMDQSISHAEDLKTTFGHNYDVILVDTVWTTQTLTEAMEK